MFPPWELLMGFVGDMPLPYPCPAPHPEGAEGIGPAPGAASCLVWGRQALGRSGTSVVCGSV